MRARIKPMQTPTPAQTTAGVQVNQTTPTPYFSQPAWVASHLLVYFAAVCLAASVVRAYRRQAATVRKLRQYKGASNA